MEMHMFLLLHEVVPDMMSPIPPPKPPPDPEPPEPPPR